MKSVSGAGLTWVLAARTNVQRGTAEIWRSLAPTALSNVAVTATLSQSVAASITVMSFTGVDTSGTNGSGAVGAVAGANAASGAPVATLVTTRANSLVIGVGNDFDNAISRVPAAGQGLVHQYLTTLGDTYWVQMQNSPTPLAGTTVNIADSAPTSDRYNLSICEILASSSGSPTWNISGTISPVSAGGGAAVTLSGPVAATTTADGNGNYSFTGLVNGGYTVTPSKSGITFTPANLAVTISGASQTGINFVAQGIGQTWSVSGTISPAGSGSGATITLSGAASLAAVADAGGNYSFGQLTDGSYTVTPGKSGYTFSPPSQTATVSGGNVSGVNFTAVTPTNAISVDANVSKDGSTSGTTVASPAFSTSAGNELLLAFIATDYLSGANTTVQSLAGAGLTWTLVNRANGQSGSSEIWRAFAPSPLASATVTATLSQKVVSSITVMSFSGVDTSGVNGAGAIGATASKSASSGAPSASLITTRNNSVVIGVGNDFDNAVARTVGAGQSMVHQYLTPTGDTYWVQRQTNPVATIGASATINDSAPTTDRYNLSIVEILAGYGGGVDTTPPSVSLDSPPTGATMASIVTVAATASDNTFVAGVQFLLDGSPLGVEVTTSPYSIAWNTTTVANGSHTLSARARDSVGLTATSTPVSITVNNPGDASQVGSWSGPVSLPAVAVNLILLPNNKVLFYQDGVTPTVWDYTLNTFANVPAPANLFCSGHALLADGRVLVVGGYGGSGSTIGIANAEIFDPTTNAWTAVPNMAYRRWYPAATTLPDGRILVTAGWQTSAHTNAGISEIYDPASNSWTQLTNANNPFETYPFLYVLPDGRVIHIGGSEYPTDTDVLDLTTKTWSLLDANIVDGGSAIMYTPGKFMKAGSASDSQEVGPSANTTFVLDLTQPSPAWRQTPSMAYPRSYLNLTSLPDGTVLATGGETDRDGGKIANAVYAAELWSPQTQTWSTMASMQTPREYHGTALLLPDGRVLVSGMGADFGNVPDQKSAEFYSPPYLFRGARPAISQSPAQAGYGSGFFVGTPDAASIASVALIRTGAVTHFFDQNARYVPLSFSQTAGGLTVMAPATANIAPPGSYMLFIVNSAGVPSIAPFIQIH